MPAGSHAHRSVKPNRQQLRHAYTQYCLTRYLLCACMVTSVVGWQLLTCSSVLGLQVAMEVAVWSESQIIDMYKQVSHDSAFAKPSACQSSSSLGCAVDTFLLLCHRPRRVLAGARLPRCNVRNLQCTFLINFSSHVKSDDGKNWSQRISESSSLLTSSLHA